MICSVFTLRRTGGGEKVALKLSVPRFCLPPLEKKRERRRWRLRREGKEALPGEGWRSLPGNVCSRKRGGELKNVKYGLYGRTRAECRDFANGARRDVH